MADTESRPFTAASFNQFLNEKKLVGSRCVNCKALYLPPRAICPRCHGDEMEWMNLSGEGKLAAFTAVYIAPTFMTRQGYGRDNPYVTGVVELDEGVKISARILDVDAKNGDTIQVGMAVEVEFIEMGAEGRVNLGFKPVEA
ncbi:MAG: Zn-ribbon domain-containing OB-fold protein [Anaerolineales bacterium]|jgi:uncharacterized OB-fold protein